VAADITRGDVVTTFDSRVEGEGFQEMAPAMMDIVGKQVTAI